MTQYTVFTREIESNEYKYYVEADSPEEARRLVEEGEADDDKVWINGGDGTQYAVFTIFDIDAQKDVA